MSEQIRKALIVTEKPSIARSFVKALATVNNIKFKTKKGKARFNSIFESNFNQMLSVIMGRGPQALISCPRRASNV